MLLIAVNNQVHILLVDDQHPILLTYKLILEQQGYRVTGALSSDAAVQHLSESDFDVLLCDLGLGGGSNGLDVIDFAQARNPEITPLLLTGYGGADVVAAAAERGVEVLYKPVEIPQLLETLQALAQARGAA